MPDDTTTPGQCIDCARDLTRNPHPYAGEPGHPEASYAWICVPCLVENRHRWARRAREAEGRVCTLQGRIDRTLAYLRRLSSGPLDSTTDLVVQAAMRGLTL